ncbi:Gfo/Idh/MocA family protein [Flavihumibacter fluvii]|uniref:Gfo/Idh/MocA family protein n=1 Tax=Flavihumibacter fluvii TaxID=2838157 RepID=UPI001BDDF87E|nr:Gfo/Idh/MocA family oxidoreductase [Flavihumibacter fluvii]ULQ54257.1 Gfo/Idh/MocA family oxidoreductase [Flavihumibacter fluvii]
MSTTKVIRWGIIGAGRIARVFVKDFPFVQNAQLIAIASRDKAKAAGFAAEYNIPQALDYEELYNSPDIDAVYIATTHNAHFEQALACIKHGKGVLCEKPITVHPRELEILVSAAAEYKVFLMEALWSCFMPSLAKAREWISSGRIGSLKIIQADFSYPAVKNDEARSFNPKLGGGALLDIGIYPIAVCSRFTDGKPKQVKAHGVLAHTGVDETVGLLLDYGPVTAILTASIATRMSNTFFLYGETGSIEMKEFWKTKICRLYDAEHNLLETYEDGREQHGFAYQVQDATDAMLAGKLQSAVIPWSSSLEWQETMMEVRRQINMHLPNDEGYQ